MTMPDSPKPSGTTIDQELDAKITELYAIRSKMHDEEDAEGGLMPEDQRTLRLADMAIDILERCERERRPEHPDDLKNMRMQRDVFCEKLNECIDKTKEAEKRAETAKREVERMRDASVAVAESFAKVVEQARQEGYERGKAATDSYWEKRWREETGSDER